MQIQADPTWGKGSSLHSSAEQNVAGSSGTHERKPEGDSEELAARLIAPVEIKTLNFAVDQYIAVGEHRCPHCCMHSNPNACAEWTHQFDAHM